MLKPISQMAFVAFACVSFACSAQAQEQTRFVLKLNNELISSFKSFGSLRSEVPVEFQGKISAVELQFADTNASPPITMDLAVTLNGDNSSINLNDAAIDALKNQPVRVPVTPDKNNFSQIVLVYDGPLPAATESPLAQAAQKETEFNGARQSVDQYYIRLGNNRSMSGSIDGFDKFEIEARFGKVSIPMDQVAGIKFHTDAQDSAVVVLNNGDSITGVPTIGAVELKTDWGQADIEPKAMDALTTTRNAKFAQENTDFGSRWVLKTGDSFAPGAPFGG